MCCANTFLKKVHTALKKVEVQGMFRFGLVLDLNTGSALFCFGVLASLAISLWIGSRAGENDSEPTSAGKATAGGTTAAAPKKLHVIASGVCLVVVRAACPNSDES